MRSRVVFSDGGVSSVSSRSISEVIQLFESRRDGGFRGAGHAAFEYDGEVRPRVPREPPRDERSAAHLRRRLERRERGAKRFGGRRGSESVAQRGGEVRPRGVHAREKFRGSRLRFLRRVGRVAGEKATHRLERLAIRLDANLHAAERAERGRARLTRRDATTVVRRFHQRRRRGEYARR